MASFDFIDEVKKYVQAGHGGPGSVHFRREKFVPKGGPDGGDGGKGGDIILKGNKQLSTLLHLKYRKHIVAEDGKPGEGGCRTGADGATIILEVPLGTVAKDIDSGNILVDITEDGQQTILLHGGRGGQGNVHFKTPTQQAPRYAQPGESGEEGWIKLELKLLAEVGLVGFPNAGKSTLLASISAAKPKIANYPFTTLVPQLGVVAYREGHSFVLADMPGIIEGASMGKGLGTRFLKHIERNRVLVLMISADDTANIVQTYTSLLKELKSYSEDLFKKPRILVISKLDLIGAEEKLTIKKLLPKQIDCVFISAVTGEGLKEFKDKVWKLLHPAL
ncbi:MAG: GTPase ObgE [Candidatus Amoebophilus sp.]